MSKSTEEHREAARDRTAICAVVTVSDTRTAEDDAGGTAVARALEAAGHSVGDRSIVPDEPEQIESHLRALLRGPRSTIDHPVSYFDAIVTTGGTGIARRDTTVEVARRLIQKELEGFGELFRMLSYEQVGAAAMLSRAVAGLSGEVVLFVLPGSPNAVELAMEKLIVPELPHLVWERSR